MKDYCPVCAVEVEFDGSGPNAACSNCGRTRSAAEESARFRRARQREQKWGPLVTFVGLALVAVVVGLFFISGSSATKVKLISAGVTGGLIALVAAIIQEFKKRK